MVGQEVFQELVVLFDDDGSKIELEMRFGQFNGLLAQKGTLTSHAGRTVKAAYAQVGAGLAVRAVVFFQLKFNAEGYMDPAFNLPLAYMAQNAGAGPDLGSGPISMACRSQCPVPWHGINMWEPAGEGGSHRSMLVQRAVWRNRLGLKAVPARRRGQQVAELRAPSQPQAIVDSTVEQERATANGTGRESSMRRRASSGGIERMRAMEEKLTAAFGEEGRIAATSYAQQNREQMGQAAAQFRTEMERQQRGYLEQIRNCREEIQELKAALRHERKRNQRLQQLLRGDV